MNDLSNWRTFNRHELSEIFPDMSEVEFENLCLDMHDHGYDQKQPVILYEWKILDGWHRCRAAVIEGKNPTFEHYKGKDPLGEVIRRNLHRRHLDASSRAMVAAKISNCGHGGDRKNQVAVLQLDRATAAEAMGVSKRLVDAAAKVQAGGTPSLNEAVMDGTVTVTDAADVSSEPPAVQNAAVKAVRRYKAKTAKAAVETSVKGDADEGELEKIKDAAGEDVPSDAVPAFQAAKDIETLCREIDALNQRVSASAKLPGWELVNSDSVMQTFKNLRQNLWSSRATHVCPYCKGKGKTCTCCKGRGWTIKAVFNQSPPS